MKALVVYESMFGNTERIARAVADGLADTFEVALADVATIPSTKGMDLLVAGAAHARLRAQPAPYAAGRRTQRHRTPRGRADRSA